MSRIKTFCRIAAAALTLCTFTSTAFAAPFGDLLVIHNMENEVKVIDENENIYHPVHVYTGIDSLDYSEVGFDVNAVNSDDTTVSGYISAPTDTVYTSMEVTETDGTTTQYTAEQLGGIYMFGAELLFDASAWSNANTTLTVSPYAKKTDGTTIQGKSAEITDAAVKDGSSLFRRNFEKVFENTDKYLYRVGNSNDVKLSSLFKPVDGTDIDSAKVEVKIDTIDNTAAGGTYTKNEADWTQGTIQFTGTGVVKLTISETGNLETEELYLEVVDGRNVTAYNELSGSGNYVLLSDITMSDGVSTSISGRTLYGNGFTFDVTQGRKKSHYILYMNSSTIDNVNIKGAVYDTFASTSSEEYFVHVIQCYGQNNKITNSCISNTRSPIRVMGSSTLDIIDSTLSGGRYANLIMYNGTANLHNVTTYNMADDSGVLGLGILFDPDAQDCALNITGSFTQYNWVKQADSSYLPGTAKSLFNSMFTNGGYADMRYTHDGTEYINTGILSLTNDITEYDLTGVPSDYTRARPSTGFVYSVSNKAAPKYFSNGVPSYGGWTAEKQGAYLPTEKWFYPDIYNADLGKLMAVFTQGGNVTFDPNFLTVTKHGVPIQVSVSMDGEDYTGKKITLTESGSHTLTYTYTDPYNYKADGTQGDPITYTKTLALESTANAPDAKNAEFSYVGDWSGYTATTAEINGKTYVMPDASAATGNVAAITVGGQTVYAPIVNVVYKDNDSDFDGFAPIFTALNITDYNADGSVSATYNTGTTSMPSELTLQTTNGGFINGAASSVADPVTYSTYGLCWESKKGSDLSPAYSKNAEYSYTDNTGKVYYYYLQYYFAEHDKPCVPSGTMITLADGSQKAIENITMDDRVLVFDHETGKPTGANISFIENDGLDNYNVVNLRFSDGSETGLIYEHGYFDLDLMKYVYIREDNYTDYIGHRFYKAGYENGTYTAESVTLDDAWVTQEYTGCYSFPSEYHLNFYADGYLSMPGGIDGIFNIFEYDETLRYDQAKMAADIEKYGLFSYSDFEEYMTYEQYLQYPAPYIKVALGKGMITEERLMYLIERYVN